MPDKLPFPVTQPFPITAPSAQYSNAWCASLRDFRRLLKDLRPRDENHQIVFRGQTREYESDGTPSLMPATRRKGSSHKPYSLELKGFEEFIFERMYSEAEMQRMRLRQAELLGLPEPAVERTPWPHAYSSLVQHYCSGTNGVDVTFDGEIALWFACHEANHGASGIRHMPITTKATQSGLAPVIYVIECLKPEKGRAVHLPAALFFAPDLSDLRLLMPEPELRPNRQQSGILLAAAVENSHANACLNFVIVRVALSDACVAEALHRPMYSESYLFPSPREDYLYCWLLASKSAKHVYRLVRHQRYTRTVCAEIMRRRKIGGG
jgi:hypothetical protein